MKAVNYRKITFFASNYDFIISAAIDELPLTNSPEVFGLHPNAEIGYYTQATKEMWSLLIELQPQTGKNLTSSKVLHNLIYLMHYQAMLARE